MDDEERKNRTKPRRMCCVRARSVLARLKALLLNMRGLARCGEDLRALGTAS
jgi:hypothetical protein